MDRTNKNVYKKRVSNKKSRRSAPKVKRNRFQNPLKSEEKIHIRCSLDLSSNTSLANISLDKNLLSNWSFPHKIHKYYASKGITKLFDWQVECLKLDGVLEGRNLVYSAPTSAGKSMVSDILLYKKLLEHKKKAIIILPFVSVTQEKMLSLKQVLKTVGVRVDAFAGGVNPRGGLARVDVAVCTIEKANNMINKLIEDNKLQEIGLLVVDELHMIGNRSRGFLLELLLTKVLYLKNKIKHEIQIVGMSATIPNLGAIAKWLDAALYVTDFRPVPLYERTAIGDVVYNSPDMTEYRRLDINNYGIKKADGTDDSYLIYLAIETLVNGFGALVFCATKNQCEKLCQNLATNIYEFGKGSKPQNEETAHFKAKIVSALNYNEITEVLQQLERCPAGLDPSIANKLRFGVAFHHAGLSMDERSIIEQAFRNGVIKILCATSTLSAGVNLPARLVIIKSPLDFRNSVMDSMTYRQMIGRAGRQGVDTMGESILMCSENNRSKAEELLNSSLSPVNSCLIGSITNEEYSSGTLSVNSSHSFGGIQRAVLEIIANGTAVNYEDVSQYMSHTLLATNSTELVTKAIIDDIIEYLVDEKLIHSMSDTDSQKRKITPTQFGKAVLASGISPKDGSFILNELNKAKASLCLYNDLHLLYEVTPINLSDQLESIDWQHFYTVWSKMDNDMIKVAKLVGVSENTLFSLIRKSRVFKEDELMIHKRFYAALALNDLVREVPLQEVSKKFKCNKGVLQSLQQSASSFAGMLTTFCNRLGWHNLEILIEQFQSRLYFGVQRELIDLMRITSLNANVARLLYDAKYDTVVALANVEKSTEIELVLMNAGPFDKNKAIDSSVLWVPGLSKAMSVREMAKAIIYESKELVNKDLGIKVYDLSQASSTDSNDEPNNDFNDLSDDSIELQPNVDNYTKIVPKSQILSQDYKENSYKIDNSLKDISFMEQSFIDCEDKPFNTSHSPTPATVVATNECINVSHIDKPEPHSSGVSTVVSSTPNPSTTRPSLFRGEKCLDSNLLNNPKEDSFVFGDSLDNISWDRFSCDLNKLNESHKELGDNLINNLSTISTDLLTNRCVSPNDNTFSRSEGSSKRSSSPSPSGKMGERVLKRKHTTDSSISLIDSDNSVYTEESSDALKTSDESSVSSVFQKTTFNELKIGDKFNYIIIDSNNISLIDKLINKLDHKKTISMNFKTEPKNQNQIQLIGSKIKSLKNMTQEMNGLDLNHNNTLVTALTLCFESENSVYRICSLRALNKIKDILKNKLNMDSKIITFDVKSCYKILRQCFGLDSQMLNQMDWYDIRIAHWILDPESDKPTDIQQMVRIYAKSFLHLFGPKNSPIEIECISTGLMFPVINSLMSELENKNQLKALKRTEIPSRFTIADMELNGMYVDLDYMNKQLDLLNETKRQLEEKAIEISNKKFKLSNVTEVSKVLYEDLNLLSNYYSVQKNINKPKGKYSRKLPKHLSTSKIALKKLMTLTTNPLPRVILDWRRVVYAIKHSLKPILSSCIVEPNTGYNVINGLCDEWTATGRITMFEPNLIGVCKDFSIDGITLEEQNLTNQTIDFSLRNCFIARNGYVLVSADYSQLELRILAHLSKDKKLSQVLNSGGDVFKSIGSVWRSKPIEEVTDDERQQSKQVVYGMIYGKGEKTLSEDLEVTEEEAKSFMESFIGRYEGVKQFIAKTIDDCRENSFVETLSGRRRYLPHINSVNAVMRAKAERQAVNSTIQGSAADLVKTAMTALQNRLFEEKIESRFVLQMYDELMYEVLEHSSQYFSKILAECMQNCLKNFRVDLPVRVKVGPNWGQLKPIENLE